jgi:serine phosphatase RsbU (regulator of sigma subunit)
MSPLADSLHTSAITELLGLAQTLNRGGAIAILTADGTLLAGHAGTGEPVLAHSIEVAGVPDARVVGWGEPDPSLLALLARSVEFAIDGAHETATRARMDEELAIGRRIQSALIPRRFPDVDGWSFAAAYEPAREVGGDLYDAFPIRGQSDRIGLLIADVTGKGIPAALLMADVRALLHAAADNAPGPGEALRRVNRILVNERATSLFVTAALVIVDTVTGELRCASAGHEPALVLRADGGIVSLEPRGPVLGAVTDATFEEQEERLAPGDTMLLYTDGVTDTRDASPSRAFYGEERLLGIAGRDGQREATALRDELLQDVRDFRGGSEPYDDLALLIVRRAGPGARSS